MSIKVMSRVWEYSAAKEGELLVLLAIADFANDDGEAYPAVDTLAKKSRMSARQVQRCIKASVLRGELKVIPGAGRHGTYLFRLVLTGDKMSPMTTCHPDKMSPLTPCHPDKMSPMQEAKLNNDLRKNRGDKMSGRQNVGVTLEAENMSQMSPEPSLEPSVKKNPPIAPPKKRGRQATPKHPFPDGYAPSDTLIQAIETKFPGADVPILVEKMRNWALSNGAWKSDWNATLRNFAQSDWERRGSPSSIAKKLELSL